MKSVIIATACLLTLAACKEELASLPAAVEMPSDAVGHYCQMNLSEHPGPKAQVHLKGLDAPIHFAQVRDAMAYQRMPEQSHAIAVIYVNDMSVAPSWEAPGTENWLAATSAYFVIGSDRTGGMGAPELVPFSGRDAAEDFAARHGGRVVDFTAIEDSDVLAPEGTISDADDTPAFIDRLRHIGHKGNG